MLRAILWDVGGPLVDEEPMYVHWEAAVGTVYAEVMGRPLTAERFAAAKEWSLQSYAPYSFQAMLYDLVDRDEMLAARATELFYASVPSHSEHLNPGIVELLEQLAARVPMAIVANQLKGLPERLRSLGIEVFFAHVISAGEYGLYKPDLRVFQHALERLRIEPHEALMVGDRPDNDVVPAKLLGIKTLLLRTGWYEQQKIRMPSEQADYVVESVPAMYAKLRELFL